MDIRPIIAFANNNEITIQAVAAAVLIAGLLVAGLGLKSKRPKSISETERHFRNVFAMMTEDRRQALISYYSRKHGCGREEAMQRAVEVRARDEGRW